MGALWVEPLATLVETARQRHNLTTCIETGTGHGTSTKWAADRFTRVITMEIIPENRAKAIERFPDLHNVGWLSGSSLDHLPAIVQSLNGPAFFWLDAHLVAGVYGKVNHCPLLREIEIIAQSPYRHFIAIDDAKDYVNPAAHYRAADWPSVDAISRAISKTHMYRKVLAHDTLIYMPESMADAMEVFAATI